MPHNIRTIPTSENRRPKNEPNRAKGKRELVECEGKLLRPKTFRSGSEHMPEPVKNNNQARAKAKEELKQAEAAKADALKHKKEKRMSDEEFARFIFENNLF